MNIADKNKVLDDIIKSRRSTRSFKTEAPTREMIEAIVNSGIWAPYGSFNPVSYSDFRRFIVLSQGTPSMSMADELIKSHIQVILDDYERKCEADSAFKRQAEVFIQRLKFFADDGVPALKTAPYFIITAEKKSIPPCAQQSISHVMENMWLKATALGLAFQLISSTSQMSDDAEFCKLIGLPQGEYALDGCVVGYPSISPSKGERPRVDEVLSWL